MIILWARQQSFLTLDQAISNRSIVFLFGQNLRNMNVNFLTVLSNSKLRKRSLRVQNAKRLVVRHRLSANHEAIW